MWGVDTALHIWLVFYLPWQDKRKGLPKIVCVSTQGFVPKRGSWSPHLSTTRGVCLYTSLSSSKGIRRYQSLSLKKKGFLHLRLYSQKTLYTRSFVLKEECLSIQVIVSPYKFVRNVCVCLCVLNHGGLSPNKWFSDQQGSVHRYVIWKGFFL